MLRGTMGVPVSHSLRLLLLVAILAQAGEASAQSDEALHRNALLSLIHSANGFPTRKQLLRTGAVAETNRILAEIVGDKHVADYLRLNAIRALEYFPTKRSEEVMMSLLYERRVRTAYRKACMRSLARAFGVKMYFEILPFLRDESPVVREGAAMALAEIDDNRVQGILANHLANEPDLSVRIAIEQALKMVDTRDRAPQPTPRPGLPIHEE